MQHTKIHNALSVVIHIDKMKAEPVNKIIVRVGNSLGIILDKTDVKLNDLKLGDVIKIKIEEKLGNIKETKLE